MKNFTLTAIFMAVFLIGSSVQAKTNTISEAKLFGPWDFIGKTIVINSPYDTSIKK